VTEILDKNGKERWAVWCHLCNVGFSTIEESVEHDKKMLNEHRRVQQERTDGTPKNDRSR
jgi:hypothetical protein